MKKILILNEFGTVLGLKSDPNTYKIALNIATQDDHQKKTLSDRLQMDFWSILASNLGPRSAQDLPSWSQDRRKTPNFGAKIGPKPPTWSQDGLKTLSRHLRGLISTFCLGSTPRENTFLLPFCLHFYVSEPQTQNVNGEGRRCLAFGVLNNIRPVPGT